jgi:hypothetical protein
MRVTSLPAIAFLSFSICGSAASLPQTMRVDLYHTGTASAEDFALDEVLIEGPWPGRLDRTIDDTNLGNYRFEVRDSKSRQLLYSRGYSSIFAEWQTTDEAKQTRRTYSESVRFPEPDTAVLLTIQKRNVQNQFADLWSATVDPKSAVVNRSAISKQYRVWPVIHNGAPSDKVDLLLLGDGYSDLEMAKWHRDAARFAAMLFTQSPFKERRSSFNVWAIDTPAEESGVSIPSDGIWRRSPLRTSYDAFGIERYALAFDNKRLRDIAAAAPYEFIEIIMNSRKYGGGGIFNLFATVAADNQQSGYVFVHEFGHHFAGLADEYYTSDVAYGKTAEHPEPWEPNATVDPRAAKWSDLIAPGTPLPTPWPKAEYEAAEKKIQERRRNIRGAHADEAQMDALFAEEARTVLPLLNDGPYGHAVGAFEGADYYPSGYYRPEANCIMFTRAVKRGFCAVCRRGIERVIDLYAR